MTKKRLHCYYYRPKLNPPIQSKSLKLLMCRNLAFVAMYVNFTEKRPIMLITMKVSANVAGLCIPNV